MSLRLGIGTSIRSDVQNLLLLLRLIGGLSPSLFLDQLCREMQQELLAECNYLNELQFQRLFRFLLERDFNEQVAVPRAFDKLSTKHILTSQFVKAVCPITAAIAAVLAASSLGAVDDAAAEFPADAVQFDPADAAVFAVVDCIWGCHFVMQTPLAAAARTASQVS